MEPETSMGPKRNAKPKSKKLKSAASGTRSEQAALVDHRENSTDANLYGMPAAPLELSASPRPLQDIVNEVIKPPQKLSIEQEHTFVDEYIKRELETGAKTKAMLEKYNYQVFAYARAANTTPNDQTTPVDKTDAFIRYLEREGTKESAIEVAEFLALSKVDLEDGPLSNENPLLLHLCKGIAPLSSYTTKATVSDTVDQIPAVIAALDCDDVSALLRMFDGCIAPQILDTVFIPLQLHDDNIPVDNMVGTILGSVRSTMARMRSKTSLKSVLEDAATTNASKPWKNPIYSARLFDKEVRTYVGNAMEDVQQADWWVERDASYCCRIFSKPGLKSLTPQSAQDRFTAGGGLLQVLWPFHERRKVNVWCSVLNIQHDVGCYTALVFNQNKEVFDNHGCQAIIKHVLGEVSLQVYLNLTSNLLTVFFWLLYSRKMREETEEGTTAEHHSWFYARCLMCVYIYRALQIVLQIIGAAFMGMLNGLFKSPFFWWQIFQTSASVMCLTTLWHSGSDLGDVSRTIVSAIIGAQWWNALFSFRIIRRLGECIMPIVAAMLQINVVTFIMISSFFTCGMAHALYTLGIHEFWHALMLTYRLSVLGDFDLAELDGTETGMKTNDASNQTNTSLDLIPYEYGSVEADRNFIRVFVFIVGVMSTVLLMNVLIGVLGQNFEQEYEQRTRIYWQTAGRIALQFSQQWEGVRQIFRRISCGKRLGPVIYKVTSKDEESEKASHLWFSVPASTNDEELSEKVDELKEGMAKMKKDMVEMLGMIKSRS